MYLLNVYILDEKIFDNLRVNQIHFRLKKRLLILLPILKLKTWLEQTAFPP